MESSEVSLISGNGYREQLIAGRRQSFETADRLRAKLCAGGRFIVRINWKRKIDENWLPEAELIFPFRDLFEISIKLLDEKLEIYYFPVTNITRSS